MVMFVSINRNNMTEVQELVALISKAERGYTKLLNRSFQQAGHNLSREQFELLRILWEEDHVNQQTISRRLQKDKYNVTKLLNTLQKRGYVQRTMDNRDRRNNFVILTPEGSEARKALERIEADLHSDLIFAINPQELKNGNWLLRKFADVL